jgi:type I restriction enzyme, S subunit
MTGLPASWTWSTLESVARWSSGGTPTTGRADYYDGEIPWAVIGDLTDGSVTKTASKITEAGLSNSSAKLLDPVRF